MRVNLANIIRANPGCIAEIDSDSWTLRKNTPVPTHFDNWKDECQEAWLDDQKLADSDDDIVGRVCDGNINGRDILYALADIVGITLNDA